MKSDLGGLTKNFKRGFVLNVTLGGSRLCPCSWSEIPDFQTFSNFVRHVPVVNDECERLCKRTSDYASKNGMTKADFSATLQLVGSAIKVLPSQMLKQ